MSTTRGVSSSSAAAALALLLLFALCFFSFHSAAAARAVPRDEHQENGGVKAVAVAADQLVLQLEGQGDTGNGDEVSELMGAAEEEAAACEEGKNNDECVQRRLLSDAHLDYIYTQHKNKP
uniref:Phytosulfokine n=1 Tax=Oryza meridionalis TaxID=40149 RepID=A0A0E0F2L4_9ORYZ